MPYPFLPSLFYCLILFDEVKHYNADPSGRALAAIAGSNPVGGVDVCLLCVLSDRGLSNGPIPRPEKS